MQLLTNWIDVPDELCTTFQTLGSDLIVEDIGYRRISSPFPIPY